MVKDTHPHHPVRSLACILTLYARPIILRSSRVTCHPCALPATTSSVLGLNNPNTDPLCGRLYSQDQLAVLVALLDSGTLPHHDSLSFLASAVTNLFCHNTPSNLTTSKLRSVQQDEFSLQLLLVSTTTEPAIIPRGGLPSRSHPLEKLTPETLRTILSLLFFIFTYTRSIEIRRCRSID
ncbi:hypothetical protein LZ31DRAFT_30298 [Colletotrichum somersetense]|nr:hypothetical protein LZ31DRAFT_30298 [Colletotrichum somersetense]